MKYRVNADISLKPGHSDPEGETTARLLRELGYKVETVSVSKGYTMILEAESRTAAKSKTEEMCRRLLANPTKDKYSIMVEERR